MSSKTTRGTGHGSSWQLEGWDRDWQLEEAELEAIDKLERISQQLPLPSDPIMLKQSQPIEQSHSNSPIFLNSTSHTPISFNYSLLDQSNLKSTELIKKIPNKPITSNSSFLLWFNSIESNLLTTTQDTSFQLANKLKSEQTQLSNLKELLLKVQTPLNELTKQHQKMETELLPIKSKGMELFKEREISLNNLESIEEKLIHFDGLNPINQFLSRPGTDLCFNYQFKPTLNKLDQHILFMSQHFKFKDSKVYLNKYQQCLTRALSLIHLNFSDRLSLLSSNSNDFSLNNQLNENEMSIKISKCHQHLRYLASEFRPLLMELEARQIHPDHINLLIDCYQLVLNTQKFIIKPYIQQICNGSNLSDILVEGLAKLQLKLRDEESLFHSFFLDGDQLLSLYLDSILNLFYESIQSILAKKIKSFNSNSSTDQTINEWNNLYNILSNQLHLLQDTRMHNSRSTTRSMVDLIHQSIPNIDSL